MCRTILALLAPMALSAATLGFIPASAPAQETPPPVPDPAAVTIAVPESVCRALVAHQPAPDVAYRPGVDVSGRPVAPADLPGSVRIDLPEVFTIDITVDVAERLGIRARPGAFDAEANIGTVTVMGDRLFFNGQPLFDPGQAFLAEACRNRPR